MTLGLRIIGPGDYETLSKLETIVEARLSTDDSRVICLVVAPLKEWILSLISGSSNGAYWHLKCRDVELSTYEEYFLTIIVRNVDEHSPTFVVEPTLEGGGNELS